MLVRLPKSAISVCPIVLLCLISYANYTIYSFGFNVWLPKSAQGKRSLLIQECMAQLPHPCEASDKLIPHISPLRRKYCSRCTTSTWTGAASPLLLSWHPKKAEWSQLQPRSQRARAAGPCPGETYWFFYGSAAYHIQVCLHWPMKTLPQWKPKTSQTA